MPVILVPSPKTRRDLRSVSKKLRRHGDGREIRKQLRRGLVVAVRPVVQRVRGEALRLPSKGTSKNRLRQQIARATSEQVRTSRQPIVSIRVAKRKMDETRQNLPRLMNDGEWRHPVFGSDVWVTQQSREGWFDNTVWRYAPAVRVVLKRIINRIERKVS